MKIPNKIKTLTELTKWVENKNPKLIEIRKNSKIREIEELNGKTSISWIRYRGIPIKHLG